MSALTSQADVIAGYEFTNETAGNVGFSTATGMEALQADTVITGATADPFVDGPGFGDPLVLASDVVHVSEGTGLNDGTDDNMAQAIDTHEDYFGFTITADPGNVLNLDNLTFDITRGTRGANDYAILTSVDGFTSSDIFLFANGGTTTGAQDIDMSAAKFQGLSSIEIRIYLDDRENDGSGGAANTFDNVILNGTVAASGATWQTDGDGDWSTALNWDPSVPNAASALAVFSDTLPLTAPLTATLDVPVTLGDLSLASAQAITIDGASALTFDGGGAASVAATSGNHVISADVSLTDPLDVDLNSGAELDISGAVSGTGSVTNSGDGQLTLSGAHSGGGAVANSGAGQLTVSGPLSGSGSVTNSGAGQLTLSGDLSGHTGSIISDAGTVVVSGTGASDITANAGTVEVSGSGVGNITVASGATLTGEGSHTGTLDLAAGSILNVDPTNGTTAFDTGTLISAASVNVDFSSSPLALGTFTLLNYSTNGGALATDFVSPAYRITFADTTTSITGTVAAAETSTWTPGVTNPTFWDNGTSDNWNSSDTF
ncbi:MAG: beta strand repeat-containing protein, partial [Opitutaceae bacterium]